KGCNEQEHVVVRYQSGARHDRRIDVRAALVGRVGARQRGVAVIATPRCSCMSLRAFIPCARLRTQLGAAWARPAVRGPHVLPEAVDCVENALSTADIAARAACPGESGQPSARQRRCEGSRSTGCL
ncbi:MAG: hypothetical protein ACPIOQ_39970, partial [Promethearchaeia archaeon]